MLLAVFPKRIIITANLLSSYVEAHWGTRSTSGSTTRPPPSRSRAALFALALIYLVCSLRKLMRVGVRPWVQFHPHPGIVLFFGAILTILAIPVTVFGYATAGKSLMGDYVKISTRETVARRARPPEGRPAKFTSSA